MSEQATSDRTLVLSYLTLRKAVGCLGALLPFVLALGAILLSDKGFDEGVQATVSDYYHTPMRDVFVGVMCAIGVFLFSYKGYNWFDNLTGNLASLSAIGMALLPTDPASKTTTTVGRIHIACAATFFLTLIVFSLFLFTRHAKGETPTPRKRQRNRVYIACGLIMLLCIAAIAAYLFGPPQQTARFDPYKPIFWLESTAIVAFGVSWLTKGQALLRDKNR
jgi:Protein of unknown function (DUF998)